MSESENPLGLALSAGAIGADSVAMILPSGTGRELARFVAAALRFGADLAHAGRDPVTVIERVHDETPLLAATQAHWRSRMAGMRGE